MKLFFKITRIITCCLILILFIFFKEDTLVSHIPQKSETLNLPVKTNNAFKAGEILSYRLHYGIIDAGTAVLEVKPDLQEFGGHQVYYVEAEGHSNGAFDWFFKVRDVYKTYIDKDALVPWYFIRRVDEGGFKF